MTDMDRERNPWLNIFIYLEDTSRLGIDHDKFFREEKCLPFHRSEYFYWIK